MNTDANAPVTKAELSAELANLSAELKSELKAELAGFSKQLREYIDERTFDAETRLLPGFEKHGQTTNLRMRKLEANVSNIDTASTERLAVVEQRLTDLEIRMIRQEGRA
ncbi:MAG: hypothetical protein ACR2IV_01645 [Bryobacteraceae bacterium]